MEKITLQIEIGFEHRLHHYAEKYGMKVRRVPGTKDQYEVSEWKEPIDIFWLGANLAAPPFETGISKHV